MNLDFRFPEYLFFFYKIVQIRSLSLSSRHLIFAPSSHNKYAGESFPGIYDALFDIESSANQQQAWQEVKRQISIAAFTVHAAAMTLTQPAWETDTHRHLINTWYTHLPAQQMHEDWDMNNQRHPGQYSSWNSQTLYCHIHWSKRPHTCLVQELSTVFWSQGDCKKDWKKQATYCLIFI